MSVPDEVMKLKDGKIIVDKLKSMVAVQFVQATANDASTYVVYQGQVYYLPDGHTANTTWENTTKVGPTNIGDELSGVKNNIQGKLPIVELTPIDSSMRGVLMDDGTINRNFPNIPIKRYGACGKMYLNGTGMFDVGSHYCYAWIVKNGNMIGSIIPTSFPQVYNNYEITVPADADEVWVNSSPLTLSGYSSYDLYARKQLEKGLDIGIVNLFDVTDFTDYRNINEQGVVNYYSQTFVTGYIPIEAGKYYVCNMWDQNIFSYNLYDSNKTRISTSQNLIGAPIYIADQNAKYIRLTGVRNYVSRFVFCEGTKLPERIGTPYNEKTIVSEDIASENYTLETIGDIVHEIRSVENLLDVNSEGIIDGGYISNYDANGEAVWVSASNFFESDFIPIKNGDFYIIYNANTKTISTMLTHVFCDSEKKGIPDSGSYHYLSEYGCCYCNDKNAAYMRIPVSKTSKNYTMVIRLNPFVDKIPYVVRPFGYIPFGVKVNLTDLYSQKATKSEVDAVIEELRQEIDNVIGAGTQWNGKSWYAYGTSITNISSEGKYPTYLAQMSGLLLTNKGISGGGIGDLGAYSHGQVYSAICNITDGKLNADLITLETGANDCNSDVPLGTIYDTGTATLAGCLNDCIRYLQKNTNAQICIINSPATTTEPTATNKYYEWADMVRRICDINRVHFLNNNNNMGYAKLSDSTKGSLYVSDNIHQTNLGGYIMAQNLWYQLRNIPLFYTTMPS